MNETDVDTLDITDLILEQETECEIPEHLLGNKYHLGPGETYVTLHCPTCHTTDRVICCSLWVKSVIRTGGINHLGHYVSAANVKFVNI